MSTSLDHSVSSSCRAEIAIFAPHQPTCIRLANSLAAAGDRGTRLSVDFVLDLRAHGATEEKILAEHRGLTLDDLKACYLFAARSLRRASFVPLAAGG